MPEPTTPDLFPETLLVECDGGKIFTTSREDAAMAESKPTPPPRAARLPKTYRHPGFHRRRQQARARSPEWLSAVRAILFGDQA